MDLRDAMFLWMPVNAEIYGDNPRQGRVIVVPRGQNVSEYPMSAGACDSDWNEADTDTARIELLQGYVSVMVWDDGVERESILVALGHIDDIDPNKIDLDAKPVWNKND